MSWKQTISEFRANRRDEVRDIADAFEDVCRWIERGLRQHFAMFASDFKALFAPLDPKRFATTPPKGWHGAEPVEPDESGDLFQKKKGGFAVGFDGNLIFSDDQTVADQRAAKEMQKDGGTGVVITPQEFGEMQAYQVSKIQRGLRNIALAKLIKPLWLKGHKPAEIAALLNYDRSTVAQYCTCFERAKANKGNAFEVEVPKH